MSHGFIRLQISQIEILNTVHIITRKRLLDFYARHPKSQSAIERWYRIMKHSHYANFSELRKTFPSADQVNHLTVFNVGGNTVRIIAAIHYNRDRLYIRYVLTHREYDQEKWKE